MNGTKILSLKKSQKSTIATFNVQTTTNSNKNDRDGYFYYQELPPETTKEELWELAQKRREEARNFRKQNKFDRLAKNAPVQSSSISGNKHTNNNEDSKQSRSKSRDHQRLSYFLQDSSL